MKIGLTKHGTGEKKSVDIIRYKKIAENSNTLLALHEEMSGDNKATWNTYDMFKVQFIASCVTDEFGQILCAFYFAREGSTVCVQCLDYEIKGYYPEKNYSLIDYKSYLEICELTGEEKLSFPEYCKTIIENSFVINSLVEENGKYLRHDQLAAL